MDTTAHKLNHYREVIEQTLADIAAYIPQDAETPHKTLFDRQSDSYAIVEVGWKGKEHVHQFIMHLEISNGKIWVQADNTDLNVTRDLERAGIPKQDIVLGFHPPHIRPLTEYAAA